jgi:hypothetical protein
MHALRQAGAKPCSQTLEMDLLPEEEKVLTLNALSNCRLGGCGVTDN